MSNYQYPIELNWTHEDMHHVISLWNAVEAAYETGIKKDDFLKKYRAFKEVIPSKGEEKHYARLFEKESGYSLYQVVKMAKENERPMIKIEQRK